MPEEWGDDLGGTGAACAAHVVGAAGQVLASLPEVTHLEKGVGAVCEALPTQALAGAAARLEALERRIRFGVLAAVVLLLWLPTQAVIVALTVRTARLHGGEWAPQLPPFVSLSIQLWACVCVCWWVGGGGGGAAVRPRLLLACCPPAPAADRAARARGRSLAAAQNTGMAALAAPQGTLSALPPPPHAPNGCVCCAAQPPSRCPSLPRLHPPASATWRGRQPAHSLSTQRCLGSCEGCVASLCAWGRPAASVPGIYCHLLCCPRAGWLAGAPHTHPPVQDLPGPRWRAGLELPAGWIHAGPDLGAGRPAPHICPRLPRLHLARFPPAGRPPVPRLPSAGEGMGGWCVGGG